MKKLILIGSGFHSKIVYDEILRQKKYKVLGYVSNDIKKNHKIKKLKYLGKIKDLKKLESKSFFCIIAIGQGDIREKILKEINKLNIKMKWEKIISKDAIISSNTKIGEGSVIIAGSIINVGTKIGNHCFEDFSGCGPRTITGGNVNIGKRSYIGLGSVIKNNIKIQDNTVIGASSLVIRNCKKNSIYFGAPAKRIREKKKDENYLS